MHCIDHAIKYGPCRYSPNDPLLKSSFIDDREPYKAESLFVVVVVVVVVVR